MNKIVCFILLFSACGQKEGKVNNYIPTAINVGYKKNAYDSCKNAVAIIKRKQKNNWNKLSATKKEKEFANTVVHTIIPAWYGTKWDFNGTTQVPQQGKIACGYFVTTVLRDAGLPIARVKLAQCASEQMITTLVQPKYVKRFSNLDMQTFMTYLKLNEFGLYIVGLDNHTGFIYNDGLHIWFIHATYLGTADVQKEKAATSTILKNSKYKILGKISADELVQNQWVHW